MIRQRCSVLGMFLCAAAALIGCTTGGEPTDRLVVRAPDGKGGMVLREPSTDIEADEAEFATAMDQPAARLGGVTPNAVIPGAISYHGGPVMLGTTNVYRLFYGWPGDFLPNSPPFSTAWQLQALTYGLNASPYFNINAGYTDGAGNHVSNSLQDWGAVFLPASSTYGGTSVSDANVLRMLTDQIAAHQLPLQSNAVYFVLTGPGVQETSGFCSAYCGWHNHATFQGVDIKYAFVGDVMMCPQGCMKGSVQEGIFDPNCPSGDCVADGMANVMTHELSETVTDPDLNAWYDAGGHENGDKCNFTFGPAIGGTIQNSDQYDFSGGDANFEIQEMWVQPNGGCAMAR